MNAIRQTQNLNKRELELATPPSASWHADYRDTAWIYIGGLLPELSEGDVCVIFSQFGNPTHLNLIRDKETGKSKGFAFLKYEDQRSCDLAVDNLTGADCLGRTLRVDHTRYKKRDDEDDETWKIERFEREQELQSGKKASDTEDSGDERKRKRRRVKNGEEMARLAIEDGKEERVKERRHRHEKSKRYRDRDEESQERRRRDDSDEENGSSRRHRKDRESDDSRERSRHGHRRRRRSESRSSFDDDRRRRRRKDD